MIGIVRVFLAERGLQASEEKTRIVSVAQGIDFISRHYVKENGWIHVTPSRAAVERIKASLKELIFTHKRSQKTLIDSINRKLSGWASYHRYSDAQAAFQEIDKLVEDCLWKAMLARHPKMNPPKIRSKYWYTDSKEKSVYSLPKNRSVCVRRLSDTLLIASYEKVLLNKNPYIDAEYFQCRQERKAIVGVTGRYLDIWKRQQGRCYYCGRPILPDQARDVVQLAMDKPAKESGFVAKLAGCFADGQTDEQLIAEVNAVFGTDLDPEDFSAIMNYANHQLVEVAKAQLGNVGGEPYWSWYGFQGRVEWCACFVSWCANECGYIDKGIIPKFAGCNTGVAWFKNKGQWLDGSTTPDSGYIIFFDWPDENGVQDGSSDHVGIVEKVEGGRVYTIEGNSGDACERNSYPIGNYQILGYGTPNLF